VLFNSLPFILFFIVVFGLYWSTPWHKGRLGILLLASWFFYAWWRPPYLIMFLIITAMNYILARLVGRDRDTDPHRAGVWMILSIVGNLGTLAYFKYTNFLIDSGYSLAHAVGINTAEPPALNIFLPLGISFYTFQMLAYVVDVRQGVCSPISNPLKMSLFIAFFPQLIAGPIVRTHEFIPQLQTKRSFNFPQFLHGLDLIALGMFKKVLIADQIAPFVDEVFAGPDGLTSTTLLLAVYAYSVQIYCDFSGYTDIGRGCAACLGYHLPINFARPYLSGNIIAFWRHWHITLSFWLRDYLYIPLGGNRKGRYRTYLNLLLTMTLGGLWHGASWTFVVWGVIHGGALAITRWIHELLGIKPEQPIFNNWLWKGLAILGTFHLVTFAWIFFRATTFTDAFTVIRGIAACEFTALHSDAQLFNLPSDQHAVLWLLLLPVAHIGAALLRRIRSHHSLAWAMVRPVYYGAVLAGALLFVKSGAQQFIYFQF
jgi:alginate O-acetyltransferase complex protein AlgI